MNKHGEREAICSKCSKKFDIHPSKVGKSLPCPKCGSNSYFTDYVEPDHIEIMKVENPEPEFVRTLKHAEVKS